MLKNKNIRNLLLGRLVSTSGDSLYQAAVIWYGPVPGFVPREFPRYR